MKDLLEEGLDKLGLLQDRNLSLLTLFIEEIELFNPAYGLVKVRDREELIVKHIFDSLAPLSIFRRFLDKAPSVADVGSGAGLPGIPLAICMQDAEFTLVERMGRRAGFLRDAIAVLGLSNARVEEAEMEKLSVSSTNRFDLIVFRAFRSLEPVILKGLFALLEPGGILAAYKGRRQSVEKEIALLSSAAAEKRASPTIGLWEIFSLDVPFLEEERQLLILKPK